MKLCLDLQALQSESAERGVGRYSRGLAEAIIESGRHEVQALINTSLSEQGDRALTWVQSRLPEGQILRFAGPRGIMGLYPDDGRKWRGASALYDAFLRRHNVNNLHTSAPFDGMGDDTAIGDPRKMTAGNLFRMATLYDLIPFQKPNHYLADPRYRQWFASRFEILREYDLLLAISDYTRKVAIDFGGIDPARIVAISTDTTGNFRPVPMSPDQAAALMARYGISRPFVMHTGILEERKNVKALVRAFALLPHETNSLHQLVMVARTTEAQRRDMLQTAAQLGLPADALVFPGFIEDDDLAALYTLAKALVMPSTSEGFGLPLLEAMRCGAPALGANATSIPEVVGDPTYLFDPHNPADLSRKLYPLLTNEAAFQKARDHAIVQQKRFSWAYSAARLLDAWEVMVADRSARAFPSGIRYHIVTNPGDVQSVRQRDAAEKTLTPLMIDAKAEDLSIPVLAVGDAALSLEQEEIMLRQPFALAIAENAEDLFCASAVKYACAGWSGLKRENGIALGVTPAQVAGLANCVFAADAQMQKDWASRLLATGRREFTALEAFLKDVPRGLDHEAAAELARQAHANLISVRGGPVLYVDISELVHRDARTGIQRVVRNVLTYLLPEARDTRIEPIYRDGSRYRYARAFTARFLGLPPIGLSDDYVNFKSGDTFVGLDLDALVTPEALRHLKEAQLGGTRLVWIVYDILAVARPEWFDAVMANAIRQWAGRIVAMADRLVCISRAVADSIMDFVEASPPDRLRPLEVTWWHLGSDLDGSSPSKGGTDEEANCLKMIPDNVPVFITVGTIEPRKGVAKLLDGAEAFWASGGDACFVLVGKAGWNVEDLLLRLRKHPELGRRLFWFEGVSDEVLNRLYARSDAALMPSEGEGFGLPLVEAASHNKPIFARDLTVFREIAGEHAWYFKGETPEAFAEELRAWFKAYIAGRHPRPEFGLQTWCESSNVLYETVRAKEAYKTWQPLV